MNRIPIENLKDGWLYEIDARNQSRGIWIEKVKGFEIARKKFDDTFLFVEYEYDTGGQFGTATPYKEIEKVPDDVLNDAKKRLTYLLSFDYPTDRQQYRYDNNLESTKTNWYAKWVDIKGFEFTKENWK